MTDRHDAPGISAQTSSAREAWDRRYSGPELVWGAEPNEFVAEHLAGIPPCRVLDLGSGEGRNALWLAEQGHRVTALDLSQVAIDKARVMAADAGLGIDFWAVDLVRAWQPEPEAYDLVLLSYLQVPPSSRRRVHAKAIAALAPGGTVFVVAHHPDNLEHGVGGPPYPEVMYGERDLAADFGRLEVVRNERVERPVEGADRPALDVLFVATKPA